MGKFSGDVCIFKNNGDPLANITTGYDEHDIRKRWRKRRMQLQICNARIYLLLCEQL